MEIIKSNLKFKHLNKRRITDTIVLHHTEGSNYGANPAERIHQMHLKRGWSGIGYHFLIAKDGTIYEGRPIEMSGAQCKYHNHHSVGVSVVGDYTYQTMPHAQKQAVIDICKYIKDKYQIKEIVKHKDLNATDCPGKNYPFNEIVAEINKTESKVKVDYCLEFQKWFNEVTCTRKPILEDGIYGSQTETALDLINQLVKGDKLNE